MTNFWKTNHYYLTLNFELKKYKHQYQTIMKKVIVFAIIGVILLTGCHQTKAVQYNVDPDQVFGQHYTAKDFGIWYLLDYDNLFLSLVNAVMERLPEEKQVAWDTQNGLQFPASDTAAFMNALWECKLPLLSPNGSKLIPCWLPVSASQEGLYQFNVCYGDASGNPIFDGTQVKKCTVEKSDYTGGYEVLMQFDMKTADQWQKFTAANVHKRVGMMLGTDRLLSAPQIMCEIAGGACCISGTTEEECYALANILNKK